jgi:hypothetical protein
MQPISFTPMIRTPKPWAEFKKRWSLAIGPLTSCLPQSDSLRSLEQLHSRGL